MCIKDFELQPKTPKIKIKCFEAMFRGFFSQVQQGNIKTKTKKLFAPPWVFIY